ncbi:Calx-beta domain-containing protein, partial [Paludisphaera sp.]|uniref:Calx-beta domain-containing protein n=1 Tax=Paludisphaera sp. TaxID=2017432 RepID=UPI00301D23CF
ATSDGEVELPATGRYVLAFLGSNASSPFAYGFRVLTPETATAPMALGTVVESTIAEPGEVDEYTFSGAAGQRIAIDLRSNLGGTIQLRLLDDLGNTLHTSSGDLHSLTLPRSGQYRVVVDGNGEATGVYGFRVVDLATAPTPTIGTDRAFVTVLLDAAAANQSYVYHQTADGTATDGSDYVGRSGYVYFAPGVTSRVIVVPIVGDRTVEGNETFRVVLSSPSSGQTITDGEAVVTILNDDTSATMAIGDVARAEGSGGGTTDFVFTVTLSEATTQPVTVTYRTVDGTAAAGTDYTAASGTITFAAGETTKTITVRVAADDDGEANETFSIELLSATNATIADAVGQGTILNDDARVSIDDVVVTEGDSGTTQVVFTVTLSSASSLPISVNWATANGAAVAPSDYDTATGTLTFAAGETSKTITVLVRGDSAAEADETFFVDLSNAVNAAFAKSRGTATIRNDDAEFRVLDAAIAEGDSGTRNLQFTVYIPHATTKTVSVKYATADGTAQAGSDYTAVSGTLTFAPGETSKVVLVPILGDAAPEAHETFLARLSEPTNATIVDGEATGTIYNDDTTISIDDLAIVEGDSGTTTALATVRLSVASTSAVTVRYVTANATATAGSDYAAVSGTLTFAPGETVKTIAIPVIGDTASEADEQFHVDLSDATAALIADSRATVTIRNDDGSLRVAGVSAAEGDSGERTFDFVVSLDHASTRPVTVDYATADGAATAGSDYAAVSGALTFNPGETTKVVRVRVAGDVLVEDDEDFRLVLSSPINAVLATASATGVIRNDDAVPSLAIGSVSVGEGHSGAVAATFTVTLSAASSREVTLAYATSSGTATSGVDFAAASGTLTFAPGETSKTIVVNVTGDLLDEDNETFTVTISDPTNATIAAGQAAGTGTILDDDAPPTISIADRTVGEGDSGTTPAAFTVSLSAPSGKAITVRYATSSGTATSGVDFEAASGTIAFAPGETTKTIFVNVLGDLVVEPDEAFRVTLSDATNATIARAEAVGTILDDEGVPSLSIGDASVTEGDAGTVAASFTVTLSAASASPVTVEYWTSSGTATSGVDFEAASGAITFAAGETSKTITVLVRGDLLHEDDETFSVALSGATGANVASGVGAGTIRDDDPAPTISVGDATVSEGDSGTVDAVFTISLSAPSGKAVTVRYATADGAAAAGDDYEEASGTVTFAPGETTRTVVVRVKGDVAVESDETFVVNLSSPTGATIADGVGVGTIVNDDREADPAPTVASIVVDDGTAQRSMVRSLTVTFSEEVTLAPGAFELRRADGSPVALQAQSRVEAGRTVVVLTFTGAGIVGGSLADGNYTLTILADKVADAAGQPLDADGDGTANDAAIFELYRFFGDLDGDRDVDAADYAALHRLRGLAGYLSALDSDGDGDVDAVDTTAFLVNYRKTLKKS